MGLDESTSTLSFDEVISVLKSQEGNLVSVSVAPSPAPEGGATVVVFPGTVELVAEDAFADGVVLRLRSGSRLPTALVHVRRAGFHRAKLDEETDPPTLWIWQRGIRLELELFVGPRASEGSSEASDDDIPF